MLSLHKPSEASAHHGNRRAMLLQRCDVQAGEHHRHPVLTADIMVELHESLKITWEGIQHQIREKKNPCDIL